MSSVFIQDKEESGVSKLKTGRVYYSFVYFHWRCWSAGSFYTLAMLTMKIEILRVILGLSPTKGQLRLMVEPQCLLAGGLCFTKALTLLPPGRTTTGSGAPSWLAASPPSTSWSTPSTTSSPSCRSPGWPAPSCTLDTPWSWLSSFSYSLVCIVELHRTIRTILSSPVFFWSTGLLQPKLVLKCWMCAN